MNNAFVPADILIPKGVDLSRWSVVACDQFTAEPEYWQAVEETVGDAPSALRLILPEAYLGQADEIESTEKINRAMREYSDGGLFECYESSYVFVERTLNSGAVRRGLMGALDLEGYDWEKGSVSPIRATEGTVADRLPPRVRVRRGAQIEMPHIMVFIDDPEDTVMRAAEGGRVIYDFDLMQRGGHIKGTLAPDNAAIDAAVSALSDRAGLERKYGSLNAAPVIFAMGDGNHSLATAKQCWEELKATLSAEQLLSSPARYALAELVNLHDAAVTFEPIHKVIFETDPRDFIYAAKSYFSGAHGQGHTITLIAGGEREELSLSGFTIGELIGDCESFCKRYMVLNGGRIDYIHGDAQAEELASRHGSCGILLPRMEKSELFPSVMRSGPFPKKSFSIGLGPDKRYYLECRRIK